MNGFIESWSAVMLGISWQLAALAVVALIGETVFRLRPARARQALWWFVLLAPLALIPGRLALNHFDALINVAPPPSVARILVLPAVPVAVPPATTSTIGITPQSEASLLTQMQFVDWMALAWLAGVGFFGLRWFVGHRRIHRILAESHPVEEAEILKTFSSLLAEARLQAKVELHSSPEVGSPVLYGHRRPQIILPQQWLSSLAGEEAEALLAHEIAHITRRDYLANWGQRLLEALLFFHPGVWLASRRIATAREELCDSWAMSRMEDSADYAHYLTSAAERACGDLSVATLGLAENKSTLLRRVEAILERGKTGRLSRALVVGLAVALIVSSGIFASVRLVKSSRPRANTTKPMVKANLPAAFPTEENSLTPQETKIALQQLGLSVVRVPYQIPYKHSIKFSVECYEKGKFQQDYGEWSTTEPAGKRTLLFFPKQTDQELRFSWAILSDEGKGASSTSNNRAISLAHYKRGMSVTGQVPLEKLEPGKPMPFWYFAAQRKSTGTLGGFNSLEGIERSAAKNEFLVVAYMEVNPEGKDTPLHSITRTMGVDVPVKNTPGANKPVVEVIDLKYMTPEECRAWFVTPVKVTADSSPLLKSGQDRSAPFAPLLPRGLKILPAGDAGYKQIAVSGSPGAIAQFKELAAIFDQTPKKARWTLNYCQGAPPDGAAKKWVNLKLPEGPGFEGLKAKLGCIREESAVKRLLTSQVGGKVGEVENNRNYITVLPVHSGWPGLLLSLLPRTNADGSITFMPELRKVGEKRNDPNKPMGATNNPTPAGVIVNIKRGETFALVISGPGAKLTVLMTYQTLARPAR
jgi:beta-lactamase regulating signal transducer with metallopeptidase domain